jgi:uncharacterized membrane protein
MADETPAGTPAGTPTNAPASNRGTLIILSYLWLLALVPLLTEKEDKEVLWHAKHGLVLMVGELVVYAVLAVLGTISLGFGCFIQPLVGVAFVILHILAMVKGINGQRLVIPHVSEYADKF